MDELAKLGYTLVFSVPCQVKAWGKWMVNLKREDKGAVAGYGDDEASALQNALTYLQNKPTEERKEDHGHR